MEQKENPVSPRAIPGRNRVKSRRLSHPPPSGSAFVAHPLPKFLVLMFTNLLPPFLNHATHRLGITVLSAEPARTEGPCVPFRASPTVFPARRPVGKGKTRSGTRLGSISRGCHRSRQRGFQTRRGQRCPFAVKGENDTDRPPGHGATRRRLEVLSCCPRRPGRPVSHWPLRRGRLLLIPVPGQGWGRGKKGCTGR